MFFIIIFDKKLYTLTQMKAVEKDIHIRNIEQKKQEGHHELVPQRQRYQALRK